MRIPITPQINVDTREFTEHFVGSPGPGGQNVQKRATTVELRFNVSRSGLPLDVKSRLKRIAGKRITDEGDLLITSHEHRTQAQNRKAARTRFVELLRRASVRPKSRRASGPPRASKEERIQAKHRRGALKRERHLVDI
jgi:ribosome-associated protein